MGWKLKEAITKGIPQECVEQFFVWGGGEVVGER